MRTGCCSKPECTGCSGCAPPPPPSPDVPPIPPSPPAPPFPPLSSGMAYWLGALRLHTTAFDDVPWSYGTTSIGAMRVSAHHGRTVSIVRNPGGGSAKCCKHYPVAAPARVLGHALQLRLLPREADTVRDQQGLPRLPSRNSARVYFSDPLLPPSLPPATYGEVPYAAWHLLGKRLAFTVDLSAAGCGCNAALYLVAMRQNTLPGSCGGDRYVRAAERAYLVQLHWLLCGASGVFMVCLRGFVCDGCVCTVRCECRMWRAVRRDRPARGESSRFPRDRTSRRRRWRRRHGARRRLWHGRLWAASVRPARSYGRYDAALPRGRVLCY